MLKFNILFIQMEGVYYEEKIYINNMFNNVFHLLNFSG